MSYYRDVYLKSSDWKLKKKAKEATAKRRCSICADSCKIQLHHLFYRSKLEDAELSDLRWLCDRCHSLTHQLIKNGTLFFPKPKNHQSCFTLTKHAVKMALGFGKRNLFAERDNLERFGH